MSRRTVKKIGNVLELRNVVLSVAAIFDEERESVIEFLAGVSGIEFGERPVDGAPCFDLLLRVLDPRDGLSTF